MRNRHEEMLPSNAFNSRGSVVGGRSMRLHGGSDMGNWQQFIGPPGGSSIGGTDGQNSAPPYWPGGSQIGSESDLGNQAIPPPNPWGLPGPTNGWIDAYNNSAAPAPAPVAPGPAAQGPVVPGAAGVAAPIAGGIAGGGGGGSIGQNPMVTLNTKLGMNPGLMPVNPYFQTTNDVQSQYSWAPRSEANPLQGGQRNWGIQQPNQGFNVDQFISEMLGPKAQAQTNMLPTPYPGR